MPQDISSSSPSTTRRTATSESLCGTRRRIPTVAGACFTYEELAARDKCSLDIFWLKDESLEDSAKLPEPHVLAEEIADDLRSALEQIESVLGDLQQRATRVERNKRRAAAAD